MNTTAQWLSWWQRGGQGWLRQFVSPCDDTGFLSLQNRSLSTANWWTHMHTRATTGCRHWVARARDVAVRVPLWARCIILHHAQSLVLLLSRCSNKTPQLFLQYYNYDAINTCLIKMPRSKTDEGCECLGTWAIPTGLPSSSTSFPLTSGLSFTQAGLGMNPVPVSSLFTLNR